MSVIARPLYVTMLVAAALISAQILAVRAQTDTSPGYLTDPSFDVTAILPPAPQAGDARYIADRAIFLATRKLVGTPRYALATSDVKTDATALMKDFSCAVGVALSPEDAPRTLALERRAAYDTAQQTNRAKEIYKRQRPFLIDNGEVCEDKVSLAMSYDYPSGHTTAGWTWALVLAGLAPERATAILVRGRAYGESRFICGAHNESAVEAGRLSATATMAAVEATAAYRADATAAKAELQALIANPAKPKPMGCDVERDLITQKVL